MEITKFEFIDKGYGGIKIAYDELASANDGKHKFKDGLKRERKFPVSQNLIKEVQKLKYFFLNAAGYWIHPYSKYYDTEKFEAISLPDEDAKVPHVLLKELLTRTYIVKAETKNGGFLISGEIEVITNKPMKITTVLITPDDDYGMFHDCMDVLNSISHEIKRFIGHHKFAIDNPEKVLPGKLMIGKSEEEIMEAALQKFVDSGGVVLMPEDEQSSIPENTEEKVTVHKSGTIDKENLENGEDENEQKETKESISTAKVNTDDIIVDQFSNNVASMPEGFINEDEKVNGPSPDEDMNRFEHSESMGIESQDEEIKSDNKEW